MSAVRELGKDYDLIAKAVGTRSRKQCENYAFTLRRNILDNPATEGADILPILQGEWTEEEKQRFLSAVREFGKDYAQIERVVGSKSLAQIKRYSETLRKAIKRDPATKGADILAVLQEWSSEEHRLFIAAVRKYGT